MDGLKERFGNETPEERKKRNKSMVATCVMREPIYVILPFPATF